MQYHAGCRRITNQRRQEGMKILYIVKQKESDDTVKKLIEEHKKSNEVTVININENKKYDQIVDLIASSDKVISW